MASVSRLSVGLALSFFLFCANAFAQDESLVIYNAQHESLTKSWAEAFTKETGITVEIRNGSDTELGNLIVTEGSYTPADLFLTENSPAMVLVDNAGLFEPLSADITDQVLPQFQPGNKHWVGIAARSTVLAYDMTKLSEGDLPKSILDLAGPSWKGKWAASPAGADFQAIVSALLSLEGEAETKAWLAAMKTNATPYRGNTAAMKAVNAGEVPAAVIYHYYWFGDQAKTGENSGNVALHYFGRKDPGAFVSISGGGILASSQHKAAARAFLKWLTGKGGQDILRDGTSYEYAVAAGAASNSKLVPLATLDAPVVDPATLNSAKVTKMMTDAGIL